MDLRSQYGFHTTPFTRELQNKHRFQHDQFNEVVDALKTVVSRRMSGVLIAPAGTGKTAIGRALCDQLPDVRYRKHYVKYSALSKRDMCRAITAALRVTSAGSTPGMVRAIEDAVRANADGDGVRTVMIFDDAHELRPDVLALLKVLTNFQMDSQLLLSLVLIGKPALADLLRRPELDDVARRIAHYATLRLLSRSETKEYVQHRCTIAGTATCPFDDGAHDAIYEVGHGNLRATDRLALKSLEVAAAKGEAVVDHTHVLEARRMLWP